VLNFLQIEVYFGIFFYQKALAFTLWLECYSGNQCGTLWWQFAGTDYFAQPLVIFSWRNSLSAYSYAIFAYRYIIQCNLLTGHVSLIQHLTIMKVSTDHLCHQACGEEGGKFLPFPCEMSS